MAQKKLRPPRRLRMNRASRLQAVRNWLAEFRGKHVARAYSRWFGVDRLCAIHELRMLRVDLDPDYIRAVETTYCGKSSPKPKLRQQLDDPRRAYGIDYDDNFSFIAGHTEGGIAFGVLREQWNEQEQA